MNDALPPPCENCPWRKDAPRRHWADDHFTSIYRTCRGDGHGIMLCHFANNGDGTRDESLYCRGWVAVMGFSAIGVRLLTMKEGVTPAAVNGADRTGLFASFEAMLKANRVPLPVVVDGSGRRGAKP